MLAHKKSHFMQKVTIDTFSSFLKANCLLFCPGAISKDKMKARERVTKIITLYFVTSVKKANIHSEELNTTNNKYNLCLDISCIL